MTDREGIQPRPVAPEDVAEIRGWDRRFDGADRIAANLLEILDEAGLIAHGQSARQG